MRLQVVVPRSMDAQEWQALLDAERVRGQELMKAGHLKRIWRVPGRFANISLYEAADATHLHQLLTSLPLWPHLDAGVEPLAVHPLEAD